MAVGIKLRSAGPSLLDIIPSASLGHPKSNHLLTLEVGEAVEVLWPHYVLSSVNTFPEAFVHAHWVTLSVQH